MTTTAPLIFDGPTLTHAALSLLWFVQREHDDRPETIR
jgi:hypothetical protein